MAVLSPIDPPDPNEDEDPEVHLYGEVSLNHIDRSYLEVYRQTLKDIAHSPDYPAVCPEDQMWYTLGRPSIGDAALRCPRCLAREVLSS